MLLLYGAEYFQNIPTQRVKTGVLLKMYVGVKDVCERVC